MKKAGLVVAGLMLAGGLAMAADPVYSVNGVGYEKFTVGGDKSILLRIDFEKMDHSAWTVYDLFGTNIPFDVSVYYMVNNGWRSENWSSSFGEWDPGTTPFMRGDSLFLRMRGDASVTNVITITGEIPGANNGGTNTTVDLVQGLNTVGYAYPAAVPITNTSLSAASGGDDMTLYYWRYDIQGWGSVNWSESFGEWDPGEYVLQPGQGYMLKKVSVGAANWVEQKPYLWP